MENACEGLRYLLMTGRKMASYRRSGSYRNSYFVEDRKELELEQNAPPKYPRATDPYKPSGSRSHIISYFMSDFRRILEERLF